LGFMRLNRKLTGFDSVFEHVHKAELKRAKEEGILTAAQLETIVHPNEYFKRSYLLKHLDKAPKPDRDVKMEGA
jgi:DNA primase large subunit